MCETNSALPLKKDLELHTRPDAVYHTRFVCPTEVHLNEVVAPGDIILRRTRSAFNLQRKGSNART